MWSNTNIAINLSMPAITFIKKKDSAFNSQLQSFAEVIDNYATGLGITPSEVNSIKADALYYNWVINTANLYKSYAKGMTSFKKSARKGQNKNIDLSVTPPPVPEPEPPPVKPNIQSRFSKLVKRIKSSRNYSAVNGISLGIEAVRPHFDIHEGKPKLKIEVIVNPIIKYKRGKYGGIQIWKDSGNGYELLNIVFQSKYKDESPLPPIGKSAVWKYKAIYIYKDKTVGQWSDETTITVLGEAGE